MKNDIMQEVWRNRDQMAERYEHNLDAIVAAMQERERNPLTVIVSNARSNKGMQRTANRYR